MKAYRLFNLGLIMALTVGLAACGGGGGGGAAGTAGPTFAVAPMASPAAATFGAALAINDSNVAVGRSDGGATNPTILKAVAEFCDSLIHQPPGSQKGHAGDERHQGVRSNLHRKFAVHR